MSKYIGCDLGGTNMRAGIVDTEFGEVTNLISVPTLARDGQDLSCVEWLTCFSRSLIPVH